MRHDTDGTARHRPRLWKLLRGVGAFLLLAAVVLTLHQWLTWPDVEALAGRDPETTAFIERYRRQRGPEATVDWRPVPYGSISDHLKRAVLVAEDIDFFSHDGFAVGELKLAVKEFWEEGRPLRGASTISQQLVKNLWLSPSRNPWRKVKEALLTIELERELEKRRILELYLNVVELGPGIYGAEAASRRYFGCSASALTPRQSAELAASLSRPSSWRPGSDSAAYRSRVEMIARRVQKAAWLSKEL